MPRGIVVLAIFTLVPLIEMYLLIRVGGYLGALPTVGLVMLTAIVGVALLRRQGLATLQSASTRFQAGELPAREILEGVMLAVAGALLLTPGFVTDAIGFSLLVPQVRRALAGAIPVRVVTPSGSGAPGARGPQGDVIDAEVISRRED